MHREKNHLCFLFHWRTKKVAFFTSSKGKTKQFFKMLLDCFCLSLRILASLWRVYKIFVLFPSVLPMLKNLSKIDEEAFEENQSELPKSGRKSKRLKTKKGFVSFSIYWTEERTDKGQCNLVLARQHSCHLLNLVLVCILHTHKEIQSSSCHCWTIILHSFNEIME